MIDEQINAAIAKELGWTQVEAIHRSGRALGATYVGREFIPNYCSNLNAMAEAEAVLKVADTHEYTNLLYDIACKNQEQTGKWLPYSIPARQRAEAFLTTLGKWEEAK